MIGIGLKRRSFFALMAFLVSGGLPRSARAQQQFERLFYYVDKEDSYRSLVRNIDQIPIVAPQVYVVDSLGIMWGSLDKRVLDLAREKHLRGFSVWVLGPEDERIWDVLRTDSRTR